LAFYWCSTVTICICAIICGTYSFIHIGNESESWVDHRSKSAQLSRIPFSGQLKIYLLPESTHLLKIIFPALTVATIFETQHAVGIRNASRDTRIRLLIIYRFLLENGWKRLASKHFSYSSVCLKLVFLYSAYGF
jgi:hypothetical protein